VATREVHQMQEIDKILTKVLLNESLTDSESEIYFLWQKKSENNKLLLKQIKDYWSHQKAVNSEQKQRVWENFEKKTESNVEGKRVIFTYKFFFKAAAVLLVVFSIWSLANYLNFLRAPVIDTPETVSLITKQNGKGEKRTIKLQDGTVIKLNSESTLIFPQEFTGNKREVELEGEAFFDVAKDSLRPFIIKAGEIITTVKGTSFNISAYGEDEKIAVSVVTGLVAVESSSQSFELTPGEKIEYGIQDKEINKSAFNLKEIAWREGTLVFSGDNMREIISKLERWYNVSIDVREDKIFEIHDFKGEYKNKSLEDILENLSFAGSFDYKINDKKVVLF